MYRSSTQMAKQEITNSKKQTTNYQLYKLDQDYKNSTNLTKYISEAQDFYNGKQYPDTNYKNMIRVSLNICSFAATLKASKICGTPIYITYTADNEDTDCTKLRQFDEYNQNKLHMKTSNYQAALNGFVNGTEVTYIAWDEDDTTYKGIYKGGLSETHMDLRKFAVANPYVEDLQNQKWVMFWQDVDIAAVRDMIEGDEEEKRHKNELIKESLDGENDDIEKDKDAINHALVTVYTRFFRIDGEVYFMCSTETVDLFEYPHPLSRKVAENVAKKIMDEYKKKLKERLENGSIEAADEKIVDYKIDYEDFVANVTTSKAFDSKAYKKIKEKFSLYPFAVFRPFFQNNSFYGRSDIKSLIPIQKGINFAISMNLKCAENNAYNKIFVKPEALQGQVITNEPGQVVVDYSPNMNGWGIKMAESQPMPNGLLDFTAKLIQTTRTIYGFSDVMGGDITNKDISGYAVQQMIKQNNTAIEQQQQLFWTYNEDKAAIRLLFYKHYVKKAKYTYEMDDGEYEGEESARKTLKNKVARGEKLETMPNATIQDFAKPTHKVKIAEIKNEDMYGVNFDIAIDVQQGLSDSKLVEQQMWDNLLLNGGINNIPTETLAMYLEASPTISPRSKAALKRVIENRKNDELYQLRQQFEALGQQTQQLLAYSKQLEAVNQYQRNYLKNMQTEFSNKINQQNKIIGAFAKDHQNQQKAAQNGSISPIGSVVQGE